MEDNFEIINDAEALCLLDKETGNIIGKHMPYGKKIVQYKRFGPNCNIIREDEKHFPTDKNGCKANIYCLDDKFKIKWRVKMPLDDDYFPNPIKWNKKAIEINKQGELLNLVVQDSQNTFISTSLRGFILTVDYQTGQTVNTKFIK